MKLSAMIPLLNNPSMYVEESTEEVSVVTDNVSNYYTQLGLGISFVVIVLIFLFIFWLFLKSS